MKVDAKTKDLLDEYKKKKQANAEKEKRTEEKEEGEERSSDEEGELDEPTQREDRVAKAGLDAIIREYAEDLHKEMPSNGNGAFRAVESLFDLLLCHFSQISRSLLSHLPSEALFVFLLFYFPDQIQTERRKSEGRRAEKRTKS